MTAWIVKPVSTPMAALAGAVVLALGLSACGSGEEPAAADVTDAASAGMGDQQSTAEDLASEAQDMVEEMKEDLEDQQSAQGGGSASLTVGDETWDFSSVLCGIGEEQIGQEGAEFVLSSIQDGVQFYVSIDSAGHSVSLNDVADFADPSVSLDSSLASNAGPFIEVDGKTVSGRMAMWDELTSQEVDASFEGTCP